jgi:hypothetical protein
MNFPKVDERVIKALGRTLAPFVKPEKPQVSPWLAASFISKGPYIGGLTAAIVVTALHSADLKPQDVAHLCLSLLIFRNNPPRRNNTICSLGSVSTSTEGCCSYSQQA